MSHTRRSRRRIQEGQSNIRNVQSEVQGLCDILSCILVEKDDFGTLHHTTEFACKPQHDVNASRPKDYWDYESLQVTWNAQDNYEVVRKVCSAALNVDF